MPYKNRRSGDKRSAGGKAVVAKYGRAHMAKIGLLGAQALLDQHGCEHMAEIGSAGYWKVMRRYGVEKPPLPLNANERRWLAEQEQAHQPKGEQSALFTLDDTREDVEQGSQDDAD